LIVKLVYNGTEIISSSLNLEQAGVEVTSTANATAEPEKIREIKIENIEDFILTENEKSILINETGTDEAKITKAEAGNNRLTVKYEIGKYWLEYSYNYPNQITDNLKSQIDLDKAKFAKKLAVRFIEGKPVSENVLEILKSIPETPPAQSESPQEPTEEIPQEPIEEEQQLTNETEEEQPPTTEEIPQEPTTEEKQQLTNETKEETNETKEINETGV